jgi:hypothetical protein
VFGWLRRGQAAEETPAHHSTPMPHGLVWREATSMPIPDWARVPWPETADAAGHDAHANGLAAAWLDELATRMPGSRRRESADFMLLSRLEARPAAALLAYLDKSLKRLLHILPGIARVEGHGKSVVLVFDGDDDYYRYVSNYGASNSHDEPEALSGGMFIDAGYGHFVFPAGPFDQMEPVVVHELTHCLVRHLPLPAWLNEGLAVNAQERFCPRPARYRAAELQYLFGRFWNADTIQEFWSGKSFLRADDGQPLSYELARLLVHQLNLDYAVLERFCATAHQEDGGAAAAAPLLGLSLGEIAATVLGAGEWEPEPARWAEGTERGQFTVP